MTRGEANQLVIDGHAVPESLVAVDPETGQLRVRMVVEGKRIDVPPAIVVFDEKTGQFQIRLIIEGEEVLRSMVVLDHTFNQLLVRLSIDGQPVDVPPSMVVYDQATGQFGVRTVDVRTPGGRFSVPEYLAVQSPSTGEFQLHPAVVRDSATRELKVRVLADDKLVEAPQNAVARDPATGQFTMRLVRLLIDGREVVVPQYSRVKDPASGQFKLMPTTIYDAAAKAGITIPILCHREYMTPAAVCRVCCVDLGQGRLAPACQRLVENGMNVTTSETSPRVAASLRTLTELLLSDHPAPCEKHLRRPKEECELEALGHRLEIGRSRFANTAPDRGVDPSSVVIAVNHNACILCDRCVRGCNEIRHNNVIGRMGKGYQARIAFDLNAPMGQSTCVACGECMVSCPTGALTFRTFVKPELAAAAPSREAPAGERTGPVPAAELAQHPLFEGVSMPFLHWNEGAVVRRFHPRGSILCREGEYGHTAFYIERGKVEVSIQAERKHVKTLKDKKHGDKVNWGPFGLVQRFVSRLAGSDDDPRPGESTSRFIHIDAPVSLPYGNPVATLEAGDIFGEMTCMSHYPRSATVKALEDCVVLEMLRNVLYIVQRSKSSKERLDERYKERAIVNHLKGVPIFTALASSDEEFNHLIDYLRPRVELIRPNPGEVIFRQDEPADDFYLVRIGFVKVTQAHPGGELVLSYIGPGGHFGEIGLMSHIPEIQDLRLAQHLGVRTATCSALDHVDLVRIRGTDFRYVLDKFPRVRASLVETAVERLKEADQARLKVVGVPLAEFLNQGLMEAENLLVLDLEKCTRCDECTKACADSHEGITRLVREGLRFDRFLVASSCRSCLDPYCMVGCPVGSIHRRPAGEIIIENWCIGCGKCAENCPYGNINMHPVPVLREDAAAPGKKVAYLQQKATTCDLCTSLDGQPSCVYACPHDAAHRMKGRELLSLVEGGSAALGIG
ncbi:MAG TPA: cyclic nucleotide-binding domain-containing protein [Isosphaeraceae bacterium]|nr:cyclic nucleotide-binding domain-containing protein [Isosphaeraceae bacterium]